MNNAHSRGAMCVRRWPAKGQLPVVGGLFAVMLALATGEARADGKVRFESVRAAPQVAALARSDRLVGAVGLADQRAMGPAPGTGAEAGAGKVAVILWDDAWSELRRRARLAAAAAGGSAGNSLAGASGGGN